MKNRELDVNSEQKLWRENRLIQEIRPFVFISSDGKRWRRPFVGILISILLAGLFLVGFLWEGQYFHALYFPGTVIVLQIIIVAVIWGLAPALLSALLNIFVLEFVSYAIGQDRIWDDMLPFLACTVIVAVVISRREAARLHTQLQERYEHKRANDLEQVNRLKDQFLAMASHELKTPITAIRAQTQLSLRFLQKHSYGIPDLEQRIRSSLEYIERQTSRTRDLIDELLDLSNIRAGKILLDRSMYDLAAICREVIEEQMLVAERAIVFEEPREPVIVSLDQDRIRQVITNLVSNALKYSFKESAVKLDVLVREQMAVITVSNQGEGIAQEDFALIFEPFYRTAQAKAYPKNGTGLGLAIAKAIVGQHHGRLWCESTPGKETVFFVELPLEPTESE